MRQEKRIPRHPQKRKSPFPAETAEKRRFGAVPLLLISQGAYTKMEIKKALSYGQGRNRAVPPCIILHILNADRRWAYCSFSPQLTGDTPLFHTGFHPPGSLSFPTGLIPVHRMVLITRYYNRHCSICQGWGNSECEFTC